MTPKQNSQGRSQLEISGFDDPQPIPLTNSHRFRQVKEEEAKRNLKFQTQVATERQSRNDIENYVHSHEEDTTTNIYHKSASRHLEQTGGKNNDDE